MPMKIVMQLQGAANGARTPFDNWYLKSFDFEAHDGQGLIDMTRDITQAKAFDSLSDALTFYHTQPKIKPLREDGKPNKPLTSTNWEFSQVEIGDKEEAK